MQSINVAINVHIVRQNRRKRNFPRYNLTREIPTHKKPLKFPASSSSCTINPAKIPTPIGMMNTVHTVKNPSKANSCVLPDLVVR
ncbi:hypothetical protein BN1095_550019 [Clostridioides difficile]|uniref:Uncharacterized protein n=1 Tax=Clostridioides difficile TaxID=1496 RepID=A0A069AWH5_CLODI|nr:hypothetical protein BN170_300025 [Clostridioides difficile T22]CCL20218.1 hypothetical protein BN171_380013 [Clostridioides difficile E25]CCL24221.1 hypothetical protein BN172_540013 [Clostridioides difficile T15]CCL40694.1 hypothetical protein BN177_180105 [Clostridioides difficile E24]CCL44565.1 hypothetical protein BN178_150105 [Clostridioides difficile T42]CCL55219.1 hypothetical protein BN180_270013 [Clostridioides difficile E14]CCL58880.1 hypothetical protein BN181_390012 [Clostridi